MFKKQNQRDRFIMASLRLKNNFIARSYFENAHWVLVPNSPFDKERNECSTIYAAQSSRYTVLAYETEKNMFDIQIISW